MDRFNRYASKLTEALGSLTALVASVLLVVVWALTGPIFNFSDTWQLFINTSTTVITFWMVFVIQNSANRDAKAIHLKLDEIIRATSGARNELITLEQAPEAVVAKHAEELAQVAGSGGHAVAEIGPRESGQAQTRATGSSPRATGAGGSTSGSSSRGTGTGASASGATTSGSSSRGTRAGATTSGSSTSGPNARGPRAGATASRPSPRTSGSMTTNRKKPISS